MNGWLALGAVIVFALLQYRDLRQVTWPARVVWFGFAAGAVLAAWATAGQWWPGLEPLGWLERLFRGPTHLLGGGG